MLGPANTESDILAGGAPVAVLRVLDADGGCVLCSPLSLTLVPSAACVPCIPSTQTGGDVSDVVPQVLRSSFENSNAPEAVTVCP